ncbi:unnamed protein product [Rotaria socialis]|uniref:BEN domain-containing protein n=2 Tax=Rotaria socialis TaxID=392032 RepID=A0A821RBB1_9BILA|nr:unnamed protein product [Rotaria socialis]CAF4838901.1 unnamed protein product [Rotaria socialis]
MASANVYEKHYITKSRINDNDNSYLLIIFKSDNTFTIKKKSNVYGITETGLVTVKDRNKSYVGYCLFEGTLAEVEAAAERLDKEINTDIESDCENGNKNSQSNSRQNCNSQSLVPTPCNSSIQIIRSSSIKNNMAQAEKTKDPKTFSLVSTSFHDMSKSYETIAMSDDNPLEKKKTECAKNKIVSSAYQVLCDVQNMTKDNDRRCSDEMMSDSEMSKDSFDENDDSTEVVLVAKPSLKSATVAKKRIDDKAKVKQCEKSTSHAINPKSRHNYQKKISSKQLFPSNASEQDELNITLKSLISTMNNLAKDLKQSLYDIKELFTCMEKLDAKMNMINVALYEDCTNDDTTPTDVPFQQTLLHLKPDNTTVDLLQLFGTRSHIGRFVALVMDNIFSKQELCTISRVQLISDERYNLIKEAVRSRFKLNHEEMNSEWPTIHESILQKRRNEIKKNKECSSHQQE